MASRNIDPETLIKTLSWHPAHILNSVLNIRESIEATVLQRTTESSSIGPLDTFPLEILHLILNSLDFQSLSRFSRTCHQGKTVVESLPTYRVVIQHASKALIALSRTNLITFHSAASIHTALLSDKCVSCQEYGPFLFLPTCERCCYQCLTKDRFLRVITLQSAAYCFGLSPKVLSRLPSMLSIPRAHLEGRRLTCWKRERLVSVKQAWQLGIFVHGSEEGMEKAVASKKARKAVDRQTLLVRWLATSTPGSGSQHQPTWLSDLTILGDSFHGMTSVKFPSLRPNAAVENGLWCFGCRTSLGNYYRTGNLDSSTQLLVSDSDPLTVLSARERRARSKSEFLEHIKECPGASDLLQAGIESICDA